MTPEEAREESRRACDRLLVMEAQLIAGGYRHLTIDGITLEDQDDMDLHDRVLTVFQEIVGDRSGHRFGTSSTLTLGIQGDDADERIADLRQAVEELNPPGCWGGQRWEIRDGAR